MLRVSVFIHVIHILSSREVSKEETSAKVFLNSSIELFHFTSISVFDFVPLSGGGGEGVKSSGQRNGSALYKSYINFVELIKNDRDGTNCDETRHLRNSLLCFVSLNVFSNPVTGRDLKVIMKVKSYSFVW